MGFGETNIMEFTIAEIIIGLSALGGVGTAFHHVKTKTAVLEQRVVSLESRVKTHDEGIKTKACKDDLKEMEDRLMAAINELKAKK